MRIEAVFIGANKSMGYFTGQTYILQILRTPLLAPIIVSSDPPAKNPVAYKSWKSFWKNWDKDINKY